MVNEIAKSVEHCKQLVQAYRKEKYGIDELTGKTNLNRDVRSDLHNSIQNLSEGLYSKESHFIFELIQNAEDNTYPDGVTPELVIELLEDDPTNTPGCQGCLCIYNNEMGFEFENIKAVSSVGGSTKAKAKAQGYIGEKGIGFKSVFAVSPCPHIFSNGYQICFKEKDEQTGLGYVIPYWVEKIPRCARHEEFNTVILLPLKKGNNGEVNERITRELRQIKGETMLFLRRLDKIIFRTPGYKATFSKKSVNDSIRLSRIENGVESTQRYLIQSLIVAVPASIKEEKRHNVTHRDITLAFPLSHQIKQSPLFAYLPTELETGLPFLVNADFLLAASRESVSADKAWNHWLRQEIIKFASKVLVERLSTTNNYSHFSWLPNIKRCSNDFLMPLYEGIYEELREHPIIPDRHGVRHLAKHSCFDTGDSWFDELNPTYSSDEDKLYLINGEISFFEDALNALGIYDGDVKGIIYILRHSPSLGSQSTAWFMALFSWLMRYLPNNDEHLVAMLKETPLIKVREGIVATAQCKVYEPATDKIKFPELQGKNGEKPSYHLLNSELQQALTKQKDCREFVRRIFGIENLTQTEFLRDVALPFCAENLENIDNSTLWTLTAFVFKSWSQLTNELKRELRTLLPLCLDDGTWFFSDRSRQVATPTQWPESSIWQTVYAEEERGHFDVLSNGYCDFDSFKADVIDEFFTVLDIRTAPAQNKIKVTKQRYGQPEFSVDYHYNNYLNYFTNKLNEIDSTSKIICYIEQLPSVLFDNKRLSVKQVGKEVIKWIESQRRRHPTLKFGEDWKSQYIKYNYYSGRHVIVQRALFFALMELPWLPSNGRIMRLDEVFLYSPENYSMFGDVFNFIDQDFRLSPELIDDLSIKKDISLEAIVEKLLSWSARDKTVDVAVISKIYQKMSQLSFSLATVFSDNAIIYCPANGKRWCTAKEVVWQSQRGVFSDDHHWLSEHYLSNMESFWINSVGVAEKLETRHFAQAWLTLQEQPVSDGKKQKAILPSIYMELNRHARLISKGEEAEDWWLEFIDSALCFTRNNQWIEPESTYIGDLDTKSNNALNKEGLPIFWRDPRHSNATYAPLFEALGLKSLAANVSEHLSDDIEGVTPAQPLLSRFTKLAIVSYIRERARRSDKLGLDWLEESNALKQVLRAQERRIEKNQLKMVLALDGYSVELSKEAYFDQNANELVYVSKEGDLDSQKESIAAELSRLLFRQDYSQHEDTILRLLGLSSESRYTSLLKRKDWPSTFNKEETKLLDALMDASIPDNSAVDEEVSNQNDVFPIDQNDFDNHGSVATEESQEPNIELIEKNGQKIHLGSSDVTQAEGNTGGEFSLSEQSAGDASQSGQRRASIDNRSDLDPEKRESKPRSGVRAPGVSRSDRDATGSRTSDLRQSHDRHASGSNERSIERARHQDGGSSQPNLSRNSGMRLISYVDPKVDRETRDPSQMQMAKAIGDEAEKLVVKALERAGYRPDHIGGNNPGYDIEAIDPTSGEIIFIEVKGIRGAWNHTGVALSDTQVARCREERDNFWLVIVEKLAFNPVIHVLVNPIDKIGKYYFDQNWVGVATDIATLHVGAVSVDTVEELIFDDECKEIYRALSAMAAELPIVGYELSDDDDNLICEFELAWPELQVAISMDANASAIDGWEVLSPAELLAESDWQKRFVIKVATEQ